MVALHSHNACFPHSVFDFSASQDGRFGWFLLTWHPETDPVLEEIQTQIKLDIRNAEISKISRLEIETWLKTFFAEYHWKLHAAFRKTTLKEKGISLLLTVLYDQELFVVEFGRMLGGVVDTSGLQPLGRTWTNFHIKALDEMHLLGMEETDITVKPLRLYLQEKSRFIAVPSLVADRLLRQDTDTESLDTLLPGYVAELNGCSFVLEGKTKLGVLKKKRFKPHHISTALILLLTLLAILYMFLGNRWLETAVRKTKIMLSSKRTLKLEDIPLYLNIESANFQRQLKKIEEIANQPARKIKLNNAWQTDLNFLITAAPCFDTRYLYIASENKLMAFDKESKKLRWKRAFADNIRELAFVRGSLLVFLDNQNVVGMRTDNIIIWQHSISDRIVSKYSLRPEELNSEDDPRINGSILVVPTEKGLYVFDVYAGTLLAGISFPGHIQFMSKYDLLGNCFYIVAHDTVYCIELQIQA